MGLYALNDDDVKAIKDLIRMVRGVSGDGVVNDGKNIRVMIPKVRAVAPISAAVAARWFLITGNATASGVYTGVSLAPSATGIDPLSAGPFTATGSLGSTAVYIANLYEEAKGGGEPTQWDLSAGTKVQAYYAGVASDGKSIFWCQTVHVKDCS